MSRGGGGGLSLGQLMDTTPTPSSPAPHSVGEDKALIILCHLSALIGVGFLLPFIVYLIKRKDAGPAAIQAKEVLNFHLSLLLYSLCALPLVFVFVGVVLLVLLALAAVIFGIVGAIKASDGVLYRYPLCIRFIP